MKKLILCAVAATALGGCSVGDGLGGGERTYAMTADEARAKLLSADFERGVLPGSSDTKPRVKLNYDGVPEWSVLDETDKNGWWCALAIEPVAEDATKTRVVNQCQGILASRNNRNLDELVDAALTDREPKFEQPAG